MNLLSCAGGGARGIITLKFLIEVERITGKQIVELFDYFSASSVGCIITSGLLLSDDGVKAKYSAQDIYNIFINHLEYAFSWTYRSWIGSMFGLIGPTYTNKGLLEIGTTLCGDRKIEDLLKPIIFPSYDRIKHKSYYFEKEKDKDILLKDVIMSCTAAPTYFESYNLEINGTKYDMLDGGLVGNAIELVYLRATKDMNIIDKSKILQLNIGTGEFTNESTDKHGLIEWIPMIVNTLLNAHNENELFELSLSLPAENFYTLNVPLDIKYYNLDDIRKPTLNHYINETEKWIKEHRDEIHNFCKKLMINKGFEFHELEYDDCDSATELTEDMLQNDN